MFSYPVRHAITCSFVPNDLNDDKRKYGIFLLFLYHDICNAVAIATVVMFVYSY